MRAWIVTNDTHSSVPKYVSNYGSVSNSLHLPLHLVSMSTYGFLIYMPHYLGGLDIHHGAEDVTVRNQAKTGLCRMEHEISS